MFLQLLNYIILLSFIMPEILYLFNKNIHNYENNREIIYKNNSELLNKNNILNSTSNNQIYFIIE